MQRTAGNVMARTDRERLALVPSDPNMANLDRIEAQLYALEERIESAIAVVETQRINRTMTIAEELEHIRNIFYPPIAA